MGVYIMTSRMLLLWVVCALAAFNAQAAEVPTSKFIPLSRQHHHMDKDAGTRLPRVLRPDGFFPLDRATINTAAMPRVLTLPTRSSGAWQPAITRGAAAAPADAQQILELFPPPAYSGRSGGQ